MWRKKRALCQLVIDRCCGQNARAPARDLQSAETSELNVAQEKGLCQLVIDRCCGQNARAPARGLAVRRNVRTECGARKGLVSAGDRPLLRAECPRAGARTCSPQKRQN